MNPPASSSPAGVLSQAAAPRPHAQSLGLATVLVASLMLVIDTNIVNVALPQMRTTLHFSPASLSWVVTGYALAFAGFILLSGKIGAIVGAKRTLVVGTIVFLAASAVGGLAPTSSVLVVARIVQGVGAAIMAPSTLVLISATTEPGPQRTRALGLFVLARGSGGAIGLVLGGILTSGLSWRWG